MIALQVNQLQFLKWLSQLQARSANALFGPSGSNAFKAAGRGVFWMASLFLDLCFDCLQPLLHGLFVIVVVDRCDSLESASVISDKLNAAIDLNTTIQRSHCVADSVEYTSVIIRGKKNFGQGIRCRAKENDGTG